MARSAGARFQPMSTGVFALVGTERTPAAAPTIFVKSPPYSEKGGSILASACGKGCSRVTDNARLKVALWVLWNLERFRPAPFSGGGDANQKGDGMKEQTVRLGPREQQIVELLLQGCDNAEIASQLKMARRTVKAHFNRLFLRFGINGGIKRVKLATLLYRRQSCLQMDAMGPVSPVNVNSGLSNSSPKA